MRHAISGRKFNRKSSHRKSLFVNLSNSLIRNEQIKTTLFKAKDLRPFIEKIITIGKNNNLHSALNTEIQQEIKIFKFEKFDELLKLK